MVAERGVVEVRETCRDWIEFDVDCKRVRVVPGPVLVPVEVRVVGISGSGTSR